MGVRLVRGAADLAEEDDRLLATPARHVRWNLVLVWFMRGLALLWLAKGLAAWAAIIGIGGGSLPFEVRGTGHQASTVYFAVLDLVAAIGLWLTSTWGGVLWLLAVMSHLIIAVFFPRFVGNSSLLIGLMIAAIMIYLTISWLAAIDE